jgi:hypothetical protein
MQLAEAADDQLAGLAVGGDREAVVLFGDGSELFLEMALLADGLHLEWGHEDCGGELQLLQKEFLVVARD